MLILQMPLSVDSMVSIQKKQSCLNGYTPHGHQSARFHSVQKGSL